jgi:hypothetical protein
MPEVQLACDVIPLLANEWQRDSAGTVTKFQQFIIYHQSKQQRVTAMLYRCALVQLIHGYGAGHLNGLGFDEDRLKLETGT